MADHVYASIIDEILDGGLKRRLTESGTKDAKKRGEELSDLTQDFAEDGSYVRHVEASQDNIRTHISKKLSDDNILNDAVESMESAKSNKDGLKSAVNDASILSAIDKLLKRGITASRIKVALDKAAELNLFNKTIAQNYLNTRSNDLGMNFLPPNAEMPTAKDTEESTPLSGLEKHGSTHVFLAGEELLSINESKFGGVPSKQAQAIEIKTTSKSAKPKQAAGVGRVTETPAIRGANDAAKTASSHHAGEEFDPSVIARAIKAGEPLSKIYASGVKTAGLLNTSKAFHEFAAAVKRREVKLAKTDVEFLGTIGIKGIEIKSAAEPVRRIAFDSGKQGGRAQDGRQLVDEFDLSTEKPHSAPDIELNESRFMDVEPGKTGIDL
jgi:hypothetical protein